MIKKIGHVRLSVIIPVCIKNEKYSYILQRIDFSLEDKELPEEIEFIVVEDASSAPYREKIQKKCHSLGIRFVTTNRNESDVFSLSKARNLGAMHARGDFLCFMDVDLIVHDGFYKDLLRAIETFELDKYIDNFFWVPVIYVCQKHPDFERILHDSSLRKHISYKGYITHSSLVEKYSEGTSAVVISRLYFFQMGGYNEKFEGWGYEDYEFQIRLIRTNPLFPIPHNWRAMSGNFMNIRTYTGWKATYILYGALLMRCGIFLTHVEHPIHKDYKNATFQRRNLRLFRKQLERENNIKNPSTLPLVRTRTLLTKKSPFTSNMYINPFLGELFLLEDVLKEMKIQYSKIGKKDISNILLRFSIDQVVFQNPYSDTIFLKFYEYCRKYNFPYIVCERGALPGSSFFDTRGFLCDSDSYDKKNWNFILSEKEKKRIEQYIQNLVKGNQALEKQPDRIGAQALRKRLRIPSGKKILFVPFQQKNDITVTHFAGGISSFINFLHLIIKKIPEDWVLVYKNHPVEKDGLKLPGAIDASPYNIYDLLELCNKVLLLNSGVGVLALLYGKPVYICGRAFYAHDKLNVDLHELYLGGKYEKMIIKIFDNFCVDMEQRLRFLHYLRFNFYSFGTHITRQGCSIEGAPLSITLDISYKEIRWIDGRCYQYRKGDDLVNFSSPIFDRFQDIANASVAQHIAVRGIRTRRFCMTPAKWAKLKRHPYAFVRDFLANVVAIIAQKR